MPLLPAGAVQYARMASNKKKKQLNRAQFRKNRSVRPRDADLTRQFAQADADDATLGDAPSQERISGKGELTRKRTIRGVTTDDESGFDVRLDVDEASCLSGRVLEVHGLVSTVEAADGTLYRCAVRRLLKTLATDQRHVVAAGDMVLFRVAEGEERVGIIERIEPRHGVLSRTSKGRQHVIVANVDQLVIVGSAAEPYLKPNLIDRYLVCAEQSRLEPLVCINKVDLVDAASLQPIVGAWSRMGYRALLVSAQSGQGIASLRQALAGRESCIAGQSGVGKSSLLNAVQPGLRLRVGAVSAESQKGKHTTTTAQLLKLHGGGYVVDTPGIRQFALWDIIAEEVAGLFRDLRPLASRCRFPNCTHIHEQDCAVKDAVADGLLDLRRYESYCQMRESDA